MDRGGARVAPFGDMATTRLDPATGFSLLEVLVATSLVAVGVAALAQLVAVAVYANHQAKQSTFAAILAQQKMEALFPEAASGVLSQSPAGTLGRNVDGYHDRVDAGGRTYLRRWSIDAVPDSPSRALILQVLVTDLRNRGAADSASSTVLLPGEARLLSVKA